MNSAMTPTVQNVDGTGATVLKIPQRLDLNFCAATAASQAPSSYMSLTTKNLDLDNRILKELSSRCDSDHCDSEAFRLAFEYNKQLVED